MCELDSDGWIETQSRILNDPEYCARVSAKLFSNVIIKGPDDCWEHQGRGNHFGYCFVNLNYKCGEFRAHRVAFVVSNRRAIRPGMCICHKCDNPRCCNPNHLFEGTKKDNTDDAMKKGRLKPIPKMIGADNKSTKLSDEAVESIRRRFTPGSKKGPGTARSLADEYGVTPMTIWRAWKGARVGHGGQSPQIGVNSLSEEQEKMLIEEFVPHITSGPGSRSFLAQKYGIAPWAVSKIVSRHKSQTV